MRCITTSGRYQKSTLLLLKETADRCMPFLVLTIMGEPDSGLGTRVKELTRLVMSETIRNTSAEVHAVITVKKSL